MKIAVAHSIDPLLDAALEEIMAQCEQQLEGTQPQVALLYACIDCDHQAILDAIARRWPGLPLVGCTTDGELTSQVGFQEDSISLMLLASEELTFYTRVARDLSQGIEAAIQASLYQMPVDTRLCFALPESLTVSGASVVRHLQQQLGQEVTLVGGTSGDQWTFHQTHQFFGQEVLTDSVPMLLCCGPLKLATSVSSGWCPMGAGGIVTRSEGKYVYEIDHQPAIAFYRNYLGDHVAVTREYPLGVIEEPGSQEFYLRAPVHYNQEKDAIIFFGDVPQGRQVFITEASRDAITEACKASITQALDKLQAPPQLALIISCSARKQILGTRTHQEHDTLARLLPDKVPVMGFYSYGEIAPQNQSPKAQFHNETFVTVLLGE
jgi:hypothetical protein